MVRLWRSFAKCIQFITFFFASQEGLNSFFFLFTEPCHGIMKWFGLEGALKVTLFQPPYGGGRVTNYFFSCELLVASLWILLPIYIHLVHRLSAKGQHTNWAVTMRASHAQSQQQLLTAMVTSWLHTMRH